MSDDIHGSNKEWYRQFYGLFVTIIKEIFILYHEFVHAYHVSLEKLCLL